MNPESLVSIVITAHDRKKYLKDAINSLLAQSLTEDDVIEIVVVKNFNDQELDEFMSSHSIKTILTEKKSFGEKLALGIENSSGSIICFMDDDDVFHPEKISRIISEFRKDPEIAYIHNGILTINEDTEYSGIDKTVLVEGKIVKYDLRPGKLFKRPGKITSRRADWYVSCISIRKDLAVKYMNPLRKIDRSLDKALFMVAVDHGKKVGILDDPLTYYRKHQSVTGIVGTAENFITSRIKFLEESLENMEKLRMILNSDNQNYEVFHQILKEKMLANMVIYKKRRIDSLRFAAGMLLLFIFKGCRECLYISAILLFHFLSPSRAIHFYMNIQKRGMS